MFSYEYEHQQEEAITREQTLHTSKRESSVIKLSLVWKATSSSWATHAFLAACQPHPKPNYNVQPACSLSLVHVDGDGEKNSSLHHRMVEWAFTSPLFKCSPAPPRFWEVCPRNNRLTTRRISPNTTQSRGQVTRAAAAWAGAAVILSAYNDILTKPGGQSSTAKDLHSCMPWNALKRASVCSPDTASKQCSPCIPSYVNLQTTRLLSHILQQAVCLSWTMDILLSMGSCCRMCTDQCKPAAVIINCHVAMAHNRKQDQ
jgi:hypothetical protein